jgi:hypothetical protein
VPTPAVSLVPRDGRDRFGSIEDARAFCQTFFAWYNQQHRHSGIAIMTPENVHHGRADQILAVRQQALGPADSRTTKLYDKRGHNPQRSAAFFANY